MNRSLGSKKSSHAVIRISGLAGLAVLALLCVCTVPAGAQAQPAAANSALADAPSAGAAHTATQTPAQSSAVKGQAPKGDHEGIKVHGHWTIEVRNPDGKLVSHTEFENSLAANSGSVYLTEMLLGGNVVGGYEVLLSSDTTEQYGPCPLSSSQAETSCQLVGSLISPTPPNFTSDLLCGPANSSTPITAAGPCFPLSITPATINIATGASGLLFSGTAVAANTTYPINNVFLVPLQCPGLITNTAPTILSPNVCAQNTTGYPGGPLTQATLPSPVQITAVGQLISVNVQLTFQ